MRIMTRALKKYACWSRIRSEKGTAAIEYGILAALISVAIITAVTSVGGNMKTVFNKVATSL